MRRKSPLSSKTLVNTKAPSIIYNVSDVHELKAVFASTTLNTVYKVGNSSAGISESKNSKATIKIIITVKTKNNLIFPVYISVLGIRKRNRGIPNVTNHLRMRILSCFFKATIIIKASFCFASMEHIKR